MDVTADGVGKSRGTRGGARAVADLLPLALTLRGEELLLRDVQRECFPETEAAPGEHADET